MRVIAFSDSHGLLEYAFLALKEALPVDFILHAGDNYRDGLRLSSETGLPVKAVRGNCDGAGPLEELFELAGQKILIAHGHIDLHSRWRRKTLARAIKDGLSTVVFGHTHTAEIIRENGVLFFNPGSIARPRDRGRPSYGILEIDEGGISPFIHRL